MGGHSFRLATREHAFHSYLSFINQSPPSITMNVRHDIPRHQPLLTNMEIKQLFPFKIAL